MTQNSIKIMKHLWKQAENTRIYYLFLTGFCSAASILYGLILMIKWLSEIDVSAIEYISGFVLVIMNFILLVLTIYNKKDTEAVHNLYLEMKNETERE